jgi:hypothetical protein
MESRRVWKPEMARVGIFWGNGTQLPGVLCRGERWNCLWEWGLGWGLLQVLPREVRRGRKEKGLQRGVRGASGEIYFPREGKRWSSMLWM